MDDIYLIAEITEIYDKGGSVIIHSFSDFSEHFFELEKVIIDFFGKQKELEVEFAKKIDNKFIFKFRGFNSEEDVSFLIGKKLYIKKENLYPLPKDNFYVHDLIGSDVYLNSLFFGKLIDVLKLPNNDIYVVEKLSGSEILIPAVEKFINEFDPDNKKLFLSEASKILVEDEN